MINQIILILLGSFLSSCLSNANSIDDFLRREAEKDPFRVPTEVRELKLFSNSVILNLPSYNKVEVRSEKKKVELRIDLGRLNPMECTVGSRHTMPGRQLAKAYRLFFRKYHKPITRPSVDIKIHNGYPITAFYNRYKAENRTLYFKYGFIPLKNGINF